MPPAHDDFAAAAARIEANPLGRLMYGQRELFHSNLIAWFFDALPDAADAVFRPLAGVGEGSRRRVERERGHLDLVFHWPDRAPLVIENKVFSLPQRAQLDEYESATAAWTPSPSLVLLSLSVPGFGLGHWQHLDYRGLAGRIDDALGADASYEAETMRRYGTLARDLQRLVESVEVRSHDELVWLPEELLAALSSSQMRAALQKARAQRVAHLINERLPDLEQPAAASMTNATPLVESFEYTPTGGIHVHLGWQLQGAQFRRAVVYHDSSITGRSVESRRAREEVSRAHPEFFRIPAAVPGESGGRQEFNHYAPSFVYQYVKAPALTVGALLDAAAQVHAEVNALRDATAEPRPPAVLRPAP